jgi:hypothetical protein
VHIDLLRANGGDVDSPGRFATGRDNAHSTRISATQRVGVWAYAAIFFELSAAAASHAICGHRQEFGAPVVLAGIAPVSWAPRPPSRLIHTAFEA